MTNSTCLPNLDSDPLKDASVVAIGWGSINVHKPNFIFPNDLQKLEMKTV
jgi:hypothetical protein